MFSLPDSPPAPPLVEPALITDLPPAPDRPAALRLAVEHLVRCGRLSDPAEVAAELLGRERGGATALNNGYAIPHCRSGGVRFNSILIARLAEPVDWMAPDGLPVRVMVVLAIRRPDFDFDHLKAVARLCRLLMQPGFRARVAQRVPPAELCREILAEVCPAPVEKLYCQK